MTCTTVGRRTQDDAHLVPNLFILNAAGRITGVAAGVALLAMAIALLMSRPAFSQTHHPPARASDATWMRDYAGDYGYNKGDIKWDTRFLPLLRASLPQHQWFWHDHGRFTPVPELAQVFLGVPGKVIVDDERFVTANGCVAHDCTSRGMLWSDTGSHPAQLIFVAQDEVSGGDASAEPSQLLWLFSSTALNWQHLPAPFLHALQRWQGGLIQQDAQYHEPWLIQGGYLSVNLVQPSGEITILASSLFRLPAAPPSASPAASSHGAQSDVAPH